MLIHYLLLVACPTPTNKQLICLILRKRRERENYLVVRIQYQKSKRYYHHHRLYVPVLRPDKLSFINFIHATTPPPLPYFLHVVMHSSAVVIHQFTPQSANCNNTTTTMIDPDHSVRRSTKVVFFAVHLHAACCEHEQYVALRAVYTYTCKIKVGV